MPKLRHDDDEANPAGMMSVSEPSGDGRSSEHLSSEHLSNEHRRALTMLAGSSGGCTELLLRAHGSRPEFVSQLVRAGLAAARPSLLRRARRSVDRNHRSHDHGQRAERNRGSGLRLVGERAESVGAGEGNRTLVISLEGCCSTIELHPRRSHVSTNGLQAFRDRRTPHQRTPHQRTPHQRMSHQRTPRRLVLHRHRCRADGTAYLSGAPAVKPARGSARSRRGYSTVPPRSGRTPPS
jgi:hypothetical protein